MLALFSEELVLSFCHLVHFRNVVMLWKSGTDFFMISNVDEKMNRREKKKMKKERWYAKQWTWTVGDAGGIWRPLGLRSTGELSATRNQAPGASFGNAKNALDIYGRLKKGWANGMTWT